MRNPIQIITPPDSEPVTRAELVAQLRLNTTSGIEAELDRAIVAARELFERQTGRAVLPTTFRQFAGSFFVELQVGPVIALNSVQYYDSADTLQTLTGCVLDSAAIPAVVYLTLDNYPALSRRVRRPVRVEFVAGWTSAAAVPAAVRLAILLLAAHFYEQREAYRDSAFEMRVVPEGWERVVALHKTGLEWNV
jgi:uncharacterized phiE125 gp8 family phage protein